VARAGGAEVDLLLTDIGLGDLHGGDLARPALELRPGLRVVYASGQGSARALRAGMPAGDAFLAKPFTAEALADVLDAMLGARG
jgi:FixJ family two-component response regulator